jgi:hypothetical protein
MFASSLEERLPRFATRAECRRAALALVTPRRVLPLALALLVAFGICDYFTGRSGRGP